MKKFLVAVLLSFVSIVGVSAASGEVVENTQEASYIYYWGNGCSYCSAVNSYMKGVDLESKVNIEKREVWRDRENAVLYDKDMKRLAIPENQQGVPIMIMKQGEKEEIFNGSTPIIEHFSALYGEPIPSKSKPIILLVLALLLVVVPVALIFGGKKK